MSILPTVIHPAVLHFVVALLPVTGLVATWAAYKRDASWARTTWLLLTLTLVSAAVAVGTGLLEGDAFEDGQYGAAIAQLVTLHKFLGLGTLVAVGALWGWMLLRRQVLVTPRAAWLFVALLWVAFVVLAVTGWYGGRLTYDYGVGTPALPP